jgi:di/tripeptidase
MKGAVAYGTGLYSPDITLEKFGTRFHGNDERIDVESLGLSTDFWIHIAKTICG